MDAIRRTSTLRRVATTASLAALLIPAAHAEAKAKKKKPKAPVITSVSPMEATVGDTLTIKGKHFRKGKGKNSVGFKRPGAAVVFAKSDLSTTKTMTVKVPAKLEKVLYGGQPARFSLRVLTKTFGKSYTAARLSPTIAPRPATPAPTGPTGPTGPVGPGTPDPTTPAFDPAGPEGDCDGDKILNKNETGDIDNDLLSDALEETIGTNSCKADTDDDGVTDGYEYKSAVDLNDDEYQQPNQSLPYPANKPFRYPNPLVADSDRDYDRDVLTMQEEFDLWSKPGPKDEHPSVDRLSADDTHTSFATAHLSYSDGLQFSVYARCPQTHVGCGPNDAGRRVPILAAAGYGMQADFLSWAAGAGYASVRLEQAGPSWDHANVRDLFDIRDVNRSQPGSQGPIGADGGCGGEVLYYDFDCDTYVSDNERDADADGLTNYDETHGRATPDYWKSCYVSEAEFAIPYEGTDVANPDTDGDGVRDGADDQDHDDVPNVMELSRMDASGLDDTDDGIDGSITGGGPQCKPDKDLKPDVPNHPSAYGKVQPFDPCDPAWWSRTCDRHPIFGAEPDPDWWSLN